MQKNTLQDSNIKIRKVPVGNLKPAEYNPRTWDKAAEERLKESIARFGIVDPLLANSAPNRKGVVIGGHFRLSVLKAMGYAEVPVVYVNIPDIEKEKELNVRLNKNTGEFDWELLANFDEAFLSDIGFTSEELDDIFTVDETPESFDLERELKKLKIDRIEIKKGDIWRLGDSKMMCGDSTVPEEFSKLMGGEKADMALTDPPYILDYLYGKKKKGDAVTGFGAKRDRRYLETDSLPDDFTELWMKNVKAAARDDFHIIVYENWKNIRTIWNEMEKYWKVKNMIVWHLPNRVQGFAGRYKFFSKHDIAMVGSSYDAEDLNLKSEGELLDNEYETALYAVSGKPHWEGYEKGKKICPTDFVEHVAADEKSSGQGIIFGTKPLEILIPYIKVLTKRGALVVEPFGGSGSTLIAATMMQRRCYLMEKSPVYAEVIKRRWEKLTGLTAEKIHG
jgi:DNA modification methylase